MILIGHRQKSTYYIEQVVDNDRSVRLYCGASDGGRTIELIPGGGLPPRSLSMSAETYHALTALILQDKHEQRKKTFFFTFEYEAIE